MLPGTAFASAKQHAQSPKREETDQQNRETSRVMPLLNRRDAAFCPDKDEQKCAHKITDKCDQRSDDHEDETPVNAKIVKLSEEKRDHEGGL